eukprot:2929935-Amphidinium_carterae.1
MRLHAPIVGFLRDARTLAYYNIQEGVHMQLRSRVRRMKLLVHHTKTKVLNSQDIVTCLMMMVMMTTPTCLNYCMEGCCCMLSSAHRYASCVHEVRAGARITESRRSSKLSCVQSCIVD